MPERPEVRAEDLTPETASTLDGSEQLIMFDTVEGKRVLLSVIADYIAQHGEINGSDIPSLLTAIENKIGTLTNLSTTAKNNLVAAINELVSNEGELSSLSTTVKTSLVAAINEVKGEATALKEDLNDKADVDGVYPDLSAGNITGDFHIDTKPYLYRALRDVASHIGGKAFDTLVGGSVAVNQLWGSQAVNKSANGITITFDTVTGITTVVVSGSVTGYCQADIPVPAIITDHKYALISDKALANGMELYAVRIPIGVRGSYAAPKNKATIVSANNTAAQTFNVSLYVGQSTAAGTYTYKFIITDLTQYFASDPTIADRAYTLEQGQAGSGIAWLKSYGFFTKDYYPYNAGALQSVLTTGKKVVGFNQWDEEMELGYIDVDTGAYIDNTNNLRTKNKIPVFPSTSYYIALNKAVSGNIGVIYYNKDVQFISSEINPIKRAYTTPSGCRYMAFFVPVSWYGTTYNHDICINLSKTTGTPKNGDYEQYKSVTYLISSEELRGTLKLVNNEIVYNGDVRYADGRKDINFAIVDLGTLNWSYNNETNHKYFISQNLISLIKKPADNNTIAKIVTSKYMAVSYNTVYQNTYNNSVGISTSGYVGIVDTAYTDPDVFKTAMSGTYLIYEKATPTTETVDPFTSPQQVFSDGTEEYLDTRTVPIPVGHETKYELDLAEKLIGLPWDLSMLAPIENGTTASQAYAAGKYFVRNNEFCKAKTSIANGATFTLGTNYEVTTVGAELFALA